MCPEKQFTFVSKFPDRIRAEICISKYVNFGANLFIYNVTTGRRLILPESCREKQNLVLDQAFRKLLDRISY